MEKQLEIKRVKSYYIAEYPRFRFHKSKFYPFINHMKKNGSLLLLASLIQGCEDKNIGLGGDPSSRNFLSEAEAREIIEAVFEQNSIDISRDYFMHLDFDRFGEYDIHIDGYNDELKIGYEYDHPDDPYYGEFRDEIVTNYLLNRHNDDRPTVTTIWPSFIGENENEFLENYIQEFIDSLRAEGRI